MTARQSGILSEVMLRPRKARVLALPAVLAAAVLWGCAQTPGPVLSPSLSLGGDPLAAHTAVPPDPGVTAQIPSTPLAQVTPQAEPEAKSSRKRRSSSTPAKTETKTETAKKAPAETLPRDDLRFLKSLPPKPAVQPPYPSIATPPIETNPQLPLLTEAEQKKQEEDLAKLAKGQGEPKKPAAKKKPAPKKEPSKAPLKIN